MRSRFFFIAAAALIVGSASTMAAVSNHATSLAASKSEGSPIRPAQRAAGAIGELEVRKAITDQVEHSLETRDFATLDSLEQRYLASRERTPAGWPKLAEFHQAIDASFGNPSPHTDCMIGGQDVFDVWEKASPKSPAAYISKAALLIKRAWCWRGETSAQDVPEDAWPKFRANIAEAEAVLVGHKSIAARDPEYYVVMEDVYLASGRDPAEFQSLLNEGAAVDPYYYPIYAAAYNYNQPQWYGSYEDVDAVARFAAQRTRAKDGLSAYARYYWTASADNCSCWTKAVDWPTMKQAMRAVAERYPEPWNLANFAKIACKMNDGPTAKAYFQALGKFNGAEAWPGDTDGWQQCRTLAGL